MNNVVLYVRVSTDEQADKGFSLRDQEQKLLSYCDSKNLNVLKLFREDHSAKSFNRPEFKKLMSFCSTKSNKVDGLLFIKWDRFSRNTTESYNKISQFNALGITVNAIEQPLDLTIPEQGLMLAVYLSMPEVENHRRSLNIKSGMRRAFKEGRYVASPPRGYDMGRDSAKKPILVPNEDSPFIKLAFELLATGNYTQKDVIDELKRRGYSISKSALGRVIRNPLYHGEIHLEAYGEEKAIVIKAIHEPLVDSYLFHKVQQVLFGNKKQLGVSHKKLNVNFPLKGFVTCPKCNTALLASSSKGRSKYYSYYHCKSPCNTRYKTEDVHAWFDMFLASISLKPQMQEIVHRLIESKLKSIEKSKSLSPKHYEKREALKAKIIKLQDLYIDGNLDKSDYLQAKSRYESQLFELKLVEEQNKKNSELSKLYKNGLKKLESFDNQFKNSPIELKRQLLGSMFPKKFQFEENRVRTADINPLLNTIINVNKVSKGYKKRDKSKKQDLSQLVLKVGIEPTLPKKLDFESSASTNSAT
ncbi:DNA invertase Pin-like site-specific DNA recombinase [Winogradskyella wandonensis]|uniref:DNA invertase Pin-like site-specific DNA recombinase n=1 Tax=Winogradskyella wandonensis TaxID=1442586 RepID=A0A4R1KSM9_9FLAO|nr:DNA invertase Pin-like site-specific DNA recombinase [Winogradskyella wandonensis]